LISSLKYLLTLLENLNDSYLPQEERSKYLEYENFSCWKTWKDTGPQIYENQNYKEFVQRVDSKDIKQRDLSLCQEWLMVSTQVPEYGNCELSFEGKSPRSSKCKKILPCQSSATKNIQECNREVYMCDSRGFQGNRCHVGMSRKNLSMEKEQKFIVQHSYIPVEEELPKYIGQVCQNDLWKDSLEKKYRGCNKCREAYYWNLQGVLHKTNQLGEKLCEYSISIACFSQRPHLYRHPGIHMGKKLYQCDEIGSDFRQSLGIHSY
jgi:KRAB domain-containing zinc finger protein